jgi:hypothetical protein
MSFQQKKKKKRKNARERIDEKKRGKKAYPLLSTTKTAVALKFVMVESLRVPTPSFNKS